MIAAGTADWAFARYEALRAHLPEARFPQVSVHVPSLEDVADRYDGFILDAFGVLNVGETPIPGAVERMARLRARGMRLVVLTNAASFTRAASQLKYHRLGFDFAPEEVVASRDVAAAALSRWPAGHFWGAITAPGARFDDIPARVSAVDADASLLDRADGFLFLGSEGWTEARQASLIEALRSRPRPLVVANPDIVAPREAGLSLEPGHFGHEIATATGQPATFFGKPYPDAFDAAIARLGPGIPRRRIAMVGDTLHTDVLGGAAAGIGTVLVTAHGLFRGLDIAPYIAASGIVPDVIAQTT